MIQLGCQPDSLRKLLYQHHKFISVVKTGGVELKQQMFL